MKKEEWEKQLATLGEALDALNTTANLLLIGSVPNILRGQPSRTTMDLDIWNPCSQFDRSKLAQAAEKAGMLFDPKGVIEPTQPYLQIIEPGIVHLGKFEAEKIATYGGLHIFRPPTENLIASKLCRAEEQDISDIAWLMSQQPSDRKMVEKLIEQFPNPQKENAKENLIYIDVISFPDIR